MLEERKIVEALSKVKDPKTGQSILMLNYVKDLKLEGDNVNFSLELPSLNYEGKSDLNFACIGAIQAVYPTANVNIHVAAKTIQSKKPTSILPQVKNIIAIASGKGGVGKSTISTNLALGLQQQGFKVGLIDADLYGPSIPTMMGLKGKRPKVQEVYGKPKLLPLDAYGISLISIGFIIEPEQAVVLRGPRLGGIIKQFIQDCIWPELDYLIIDLPPGTGDIQLTLVQTVPITGAILVTTPQEVAVADAVKAMNMFLLPSVNVPILGVVENMSWFTPLELPDNKYYIFGKGGGASMAQKSASTLLGQVPIVQGIREGGDSGKPVILEENHPAATIFKNVALKVTEVTEKRNANLAPTTIVKMQS